MTRTLVKTRRPITQHTYDGASAQLSFVFRDPTSSPLSKLSIVTLKFTLTDAATGAVINGRNAQTVLDANGGTLAEDAEAGTVVLTLRLSPDDNPYIGPLVEGIGRLFGKLAWTWIDGDGREHVGIREIELLIQSIIPPANLATASLSAAGVGFSSAASFSS